jgi:hypothetical protein
MKKEESVKAHPDRHHDRMTTACKAGCNSLLRRLADNDKKIYKKNQKIFAGLKNVCNFAPNTNKNRNDNQMFYRMRNNDAALGFFNGHNLVVCDYLLERERERERCPGVYIYVRTRAEYTEKQSNKSHNPISDFVEKSDKKAFFYSQELLPEQIFPEQICNDNCWCPSLQGTKQSGNIYDVRIVSHARNDVKLFPSGIASPSISSIRICNTILLRFTNPHTKNSKMNLITNTLTK